MVFLQWILRVRFVFIHRPKDENGDETTLRTTTELRVNVQGRGSPGEIYWDAVMVFGDLDIAESYILNHLLVKGISSYKCEFKLTKPGRYVIRAIDFESQLCVLKDENNHMSNLRNTACVGHLEIEVVEIDLKIHSDQVEFYDDGEE